jgi:formylglycine-generating enzyme required for sulfatase activity
MSASERSPWSAGLPSAAWGRLERVVAQFEDAWRRGERPTLDDYLTGSGNDRRALLVELIHADLHYRLQAGEPARVEDYLSRYPELITDPGAVLDLIDAEYQLRRGEAGCAVAQYFERFPAYAAELPARLAAPPTGTQTRPPATPVVGPASEAAPFPLAGSPEAAAPVCVPGYEVLGELDRGGMGVVYLGKNRLMDRLEVLKVVHKPLQDQPGMAGRFLREIRSAAQLRHPHIVTAYSALQAGDLLVFAMEYIEGENLAKVVKARGPLPVAEACSYVQQAALGLQHAHEQGMVHRDIKPGNLILARGGKEPVVKILDFGLAKATPEQEGTGHDRTWSGQVLGTPDYMAPEQSEDAAHADGRADVYSLGCTLYFLLAGRPPFQAKSLFGLMQAHLSQEATPLNEVRAAVPAALAAVVAKMLAKDPGQRYQTPAEVVQALAPYVRPGGERGAAKVSPPAVVSPGTGTLAGRGTSPGKGRVEGAPKPPAKVPAPEPEEEGAPFRGIFEEPTRTPPVRRAKWSREAGAPAPAAWAKRPLVLGGAGLAVLLLALIGVWAAGVFRVQTADGILVIEVNEPNPDVFVDGEKVPVTWGGGGKRAEIGVKPGTRKVQLKKDGFTVYGEEVEVQDGKRRVLTATLVALAPPEPSGDARLPAKVKDVSGIDLVAIPKGWFYMGSKEGDTDAFDGEKPRHRVTISQPFSLGKYKVTVGQFKRFVEATGYKTEAEKAGDNITWKSPGFAQAEGHPVVYVSWNDADAFCRWLAEKTGAKVRLPREAEWEYSCRAGATTKFSFGDNDADLGDYAWYAGNSGGGTHSCGLKKANAFGLYDMHGLAWEWCADGKRTYKTQDETDPEGPTTAGASRVFRGGSWHIGPRSCRAAFRLVYAPSFRDVNFGFRVLVSR